VKLRFVGGVHLLVLVVLAGLVSQIFPMADLPAQEVDYSQSFRVYTGEGEPATLEDVVQAMAGAEAVLVGETHTDPVGHWVEDIEGGWASPWAIRGVYWFDRGYSLLEVYTPDGRLDEVYVNISSPVEIGDGELRFTDYELDVSRKPPHPARIEDEDEFREAAAKYGYSEAFQEACYEVAREAMGLADRWVAQGMPADH